MVANTYREGLPERDTANRPRSNRIFTATDDASLDLDKVQLACPHAHILLRLAVNPHDDKDTKQLRARRVKKKGQAKNQIK